MMRAPITPGTQAHKVRRKTISIDPHPLSITASGGKMMHNITRQIDIFLFFHSVQLQDNLKGYSRDDIPV